MLLVYSSIPSVKRKNIITSLENFQVDRTSRKQCTLYVLWIISISKDQKLITVYLGNYHYAIRSSFIRTSEGNDASIIHINWYWISYSVLHLQRTRQQAMKNCTHITTLQNYIPTVSVQLWYSSRKNVSEFHFTC